MQRSPKSLPESPWCSVESESISDMRSCSTHVPSTSSSRQLASRPKDWRGNVPESKSIYAAESRVRRAVMSCQSRMRQDLNSLRPGLWRGLRRWRLHSAVVAHEASSTTGTLSSTYSGAAVVASEIWAVRSLDWWLCGSVSIS